MTTPREWRASAHDPQTMREVDRIWFAARDQGDRLDAFEKRHACRLVVVARRTVNLANTAEVGSWEIVRTERPDA